MARKSTKTMPGAESKKDASITFRLSKNSKEWLEDLARQRNTDLSKLILGSVGLMAGIDADCHKWIVEKSEETGLQLHALYSGMIAFGIGTRQAELDFFVNDSVSCPEFTMRGGVPVTGQRRLEIIMGETRKKLQLMLAGLLFCCGSDNWDEKATEFMRVLYERYQVQMAVEQVMSGVKPGALD